MSTTEESVEAERQAELQKQKEMSSQGGAGDISARNGAPTIERENVLNESIQALPQGSLLLQVNNFAELLCLISPFSGQEGDDDVEEFFSKIHDAAQIGDWSEHQIIMAAKVKLIGEASRFVKSNPLLKNTKSVEHFKGELVKRFGKIDTGGNLLKFTQATQKHSESTRGFLSRISSLAYTCFQNDAKLRDQMLVNQALKGLSSNTRRFVMGQMPKTFDDIWKAALQEESCLEYDKNNAEINVGAAISQIDRQKSDLDEIKQLLQMNMLESEKKINDLAAQVQSLSMQLNNQNNRRDFQPRYPPRRNFTCYSCGRPGHISKYCREKGKKEEETIPKSLN